MGENAVFNGPKSWWLRKRRLELEGLENASRTGRLMLLNIANQEFDLAQDFARITKETDLGLLSPYLTHIKSLCLVV